MYALDGVAHRSIVDEGADDRVWTQRVSRLQCENLGYYPFHKFIMDRASMSTLRVFIQI